ncbi:MAG: alpha/beta hydrolase [Candidatus Lokiarchaeota archaeon]|nr:alpha/beta hydrolase [Candidatus Lokiarchaeota archaeon]
MKENFNLKTGYFEDGLPYGRIGNGNKILVSLEGLSFVNEPPSNFELKEFIKSADVLTEDYTIFLVGRKPNSPANYSYKSMIVDYAKMIHREFKIPVDVMGISTGGHLAQFLAADHPDIVRKLIIISAAFRTSEKGLEIEARAAEYFKQKNYVKTLETIFELIMTSKFIRKFSMVFIRFFIKKIFRDVRYPNDFLNEIRADREMNSKNRLKDILAPTLIICGDLDLCYDFEDVKATAEGIPNAELKIYKGIGHNLMRNKRKDAKNDILNFLTRS